MGARRCVRIRQVLNNLVGNALKFTAQGEVTVRLQARVDGGYVRLEGSVADTGPGIPTERLETIFEAFRQTEEGVRRGGAGLGLAVCRQIVSRMDGQIAARPRAEGGSLFEFDVTLHRLPEPQELVEPDLPVTAAGGAIHVLIADDNPTNRLVATTLCEIFGCTSEAVENGLQAVEAAASGRFDLVLMDIKMPEMDGVEATRRIRSGSGLMSHLPILALTANADPADAAFYRYCGMNGVVEKPIKADRLLAAMSAVLRTETDEFARAG